MQEDLQAAAALGCVRASAAARRRFRAGRIAPFHASRAEHWLDAGPGPAHRVRVRLKLVNYTYGRTGFAVALLASFMVSGTILMRVVQRLWR
jgi:hypothetical protein